MIERAHVNPKMVRWAREYAGYVGEYEDKLPKNIKSWENGDKIPTWNQLRVLSKKLNVPTAFFFMKSSPNVEELPNLINFRKINTLSPYSPNLIYNIRKSEYRRQVFIELAEELNENIPSFRVPKINASKDSFSKFIRKKLEIPINIQKSWFKSYGYDTYHLNHWKDAISQNFGVLIFESENVDISEMRGLCIMHDEIPVILLNGKDTPDGRIFSLFHELTHLLFGNSAICGGDFMRFEEIFCNSVAEEFLVPRDDLLNNCDGDITDLSNNYGVSKSQILMRLPDCGIINKSNHLNSIPVKSDKSGGNYLDNKIKYNGRAYYSIILKAYDSGLITSFEASKYADLTRTQFGLLHERLIDA